MEPVLCLKDFSRRLRLVHPVAILYTIVAVTWQVPAAQHDSQAIQPTLLGRYLLVASEGLYVVERDGSSSWSYHPAPAGQQILGMEDDIIYDGWALPHDHYLFSTHRYIREIDRDKRTVWEYRVTAPAEVKSGVPLSNGRIAVLNSEEQAILELQPGTSEVLHRVPVPAKGTDHTHYMLLRRTPEGNYLVALNPQRSIFGEGLLIQ